MYEEPYWDERPREDSGNHGSGGGYGWYGGGGSGSGGHGWGGSSGGSGSGGGGGIGGWDHDIEEEEEEKEEKEEKVEDGNYTLKHTIYGELMSQDGKLIACNKACETVPTLLAWVSDHGEEEEDKHDRCLLIALSWDGNYPVSFFSPVDLGWAFPEGFEKERKPAYIGCFPFPERGQVLTVFAKWQEGHYNIADIYQCSFAILGVRIPDQNYSLIEWRKVADIAISKKGKIRVNGGVCSLKGNERFLI